MYKELLARNIWRAFFAITEALEELAPTKEILKKVLDFETSGEDALDNIFDELNKAEKSSKEDEING